MSLRDSDAFSLRIGWERLGESPADFSVPRWARRSPAKSSPKICATRWDGRKARGEGWATYLTASLPLRATLASSVGVADIAEGAAAGSSPERNTTGHDCEVRVTV